MIDLLRAETQSLHAALDAAIDLTDYPRFLVATLSAVARLEPAVATHLPDLISDERITALRGDLAELAIEPIAPLPAPTFASASEAFGAAYVMEGSTLGGMVLADRVGSPATRYLRLRGKTTGSRWKHFLAELEDRAVDPIACVRTARATFERYAAAYGVTL